MKAIDLFSGAGGFTEGARAAGVDVVWAANHWQRAVEVHAANHPETEHVCQDLHQADWSRVPSMDLVLASPACQGHSRARGKDRPRHDAARSTAWAVVSCLEYHRPRFAVIENVPEFRAWSLFPAWSLALETLGYTLTSSTIDSADCGVPQHRRRLFLVACLDGQVNLGTPRHELRPVADILDWASGRWSEIHKPGRAAATLARVKAGRRDYGSRFVMPYYGSGSGLTGRSIDRPLGTVTTRDRWAVVDGDCMRMLTPSEYQGAMGFPSSYRLPPTRKQAIHLLGNAVCPPVAEWIIRKIKRSDP